MPDHESRLRPSATIPWCSWRDLTVAGAVNVSRSDDAAVTRFASLEIWCPDVSRRDAATKWRHKLGRDWPWVLEENRGTFEAWGLCREPKGPSTDVLAARGLTVPLRLPSVLALPLSWLIHFVLVLRSPHVDVLIAPTPYSAVGAVLGLALRRKSRRPVFVVRIMGALSSKLRRVYGRARMADVLEHLEGWALRRADLVVPMGRFTHDLAKRAAVPDHQIVILPFPTAWRGSHYFPPTQQREAVILCAARLVPEKGVGTLLDAFARIHSTVSDARLQIAGDGPLRAALQARARHLGIEDRVSFLGWREPSDMPALYARALVVVLPSHTEEGLGMALIEAGLAGCVLVGSDLGGIRDVVHPDRNGALVPPGDARALAGVLIDLLSDPSKARALGNAAREDSLAYLARREEAMREVRRRIRTLAGRGPRAAAGSE
jgi:glycosyltransferase involved in cell wall biosynthesis